MKPANESVQWDCAECGCRNSAVFGTASFVCPACGYEAFEDDLRQTYRSVREGLFRRPSFSGLNRSAFQSDSIPKSTKTLLQNDCPFLGSLRRWSDLTLLDVLWILRAAPDTVAVLPLHTIERAIWNIIEKSTDDPTATFAAALGNGKSKAVSVFLRDGNADDLRRQERLLTAFGWSRWTEPECKKIARNLLDAVLRTSNKQAIREFSPESQLNLWRADPTRSGIDVTPLIPSLSSSDLVFALGRGILKPDVLESTVSNQWTPKDWLALLRLPGLDLPDKSRNEIASRWNEFGWSSETLADLVMENPNARRVFPVLSSGTTADLLFKHPEFSSWMATDGWFNRIATQDWLRLLSKEEVLLQTEVLDYARKSVLPGLSDSDRDRLIENNLDIAAFYPLDTLPEKTIVNLYVAGRHDACFEGFDFSSLSRSGWLSLLSRCGERIPPVAAGFFLKEGTGLGPEMVEPLLSGNPALLPFFSETQISRLSTKTFLRLCKQTGAPDFLVSAYPVKTWTHKSKEEFLARYPWTEKYFDWTSWPIWAIDRVTQSNRMLERAYPHRGRLFVYRHWKWFSGIVTAAILTVGLIVFSATAPIRRDIQLSREREENKRNEAKIAEANFKASEKYARIAADEANAKSNALKMAEAERETQQSREREQFEVEKRRIAEAEAETARAKARQFEADAERKKAEAAIAEEEATRTKAEAAIAEAKKSMAEAERKKAEARKSEADAERKKAEAAIAEAKAREQVATAEQQRLAAKEREQFRTTSASIRDALTKGDFRRARSLLLEVTPKEAKANEQWISSVNKFACELEKAEHKDADAAFWIGNQFASGHSSIVPGDDAIALDWFTRAAKTGSAIAMRCLGVMYKNGRGTQKDPEEAVRWYRKAVDAGDGQAAYYLGSMYLRSDGEQDGGLKRNEAKAFQLFKKGAENGSADAKYKLGECLYFGIGCERNLLEAIRVANEAKSEGSKLSSQLDSIIH